MISSATLICEIFLLGVAAQVGERHHGDRRLVGDSEGPCRFRRDVRHGCRVGSLRVAYDADEADALAWKGLDQTLCLAAVADRAPRRIDARSKRRFGNDAAMPDGCDEIVPADHAILVADQVFQEIEDLRLDRNQIGAAPQLAPVGIESAVVEQIEQLPLPQPAFVIRRNRTAPRVEEKSMIP
jgi:hypothetical protein